MAEAPCNFSPLSDSMLRAKWVGRHRSHFLQAPRDVSTELVGFTERTQPTQGSFAVRRRRVDQHARIGSPSSGLRE